MTAATDPPLPSFSEQVSSQLGGWRGMVETSVPIVAFVLANVVWSVRPAVLVAVFVALAIGAFRLQRKEPVRHAVNGLFGVALGAALAWNTGEAKTFYLPGILMTLAYGLALLGSVAFRRPLVGWLWSVIADKGGTRWYREDGLRRTFGWLTVVWAGVFGAKFVVNVWVWNASGLSDEEKASILGAMRIALGAPPYFLLLALTIWAVRRYHRSADGVVPA